MDSDVTAVATIRILTDLNTLLVDGAGNVKGVATAIAVPTSWRVDEPWNVWDRSTLFTGGRSVAGGLDRLGLSYLIARYDETDFMIAGPFVAESSRVRRPDDLPVGQRPLWTDFVGSLPRKNPRQIEATRELLRMSRYLVPQEPDDFHQPVPLVETQGRDVGSLPDEITATYAAERRVRLAIARGDRQELATIFRSKSELDAFSDRLPEDPLRLRKNLVVVLNTVCRLAAEKGGLHPVELHALSEKYAILIERCHTTVELDRIARDVMFGYCDAVRTHSLSSYSGPVRRAASYVLHHIETNLSLALLAKHAGCNSSYLSRRFKLETGVALTSYINRKRIDAAKWLLEDESISVTDVALRVGFEDVNYFSRVFRTVAGITATQYRRNQLSERPDGIPVTPRA